MAGKTRLAILAAIAGLLFGLFDLLAALVSGFSAPGWVGPLAIVLTAGALVLSFIP